MEKLYCSKCGYQWITRKEGRPLSCPNCKIRNWDSEGYTSCEVCGRNFLHIATHHKDGNRKNNDKSNLIKVCRDCHSIIHNGLRDKDRKSLDGKTIKSRTRKYAGKDEIKEKLNELREVWLNSKFVENRGKI